jgi:hypothetical protein
MFVMQATQHRSGEHAETLGDPVAGQWCRAGHNEAGQVGKYPRDDPSQHDYDMIVPPDPISNRSRCGAFAERWHDRGVIG